MIEIKTARDKILFAIIYKTVTHLDDMKMIRRNTCGCCNYNRMCDENNDCNEGIAEYIYNTIKENTNNGHK